MVDGTYQHEETGRIVVTSKQPSRRWIPVPAGSLEGACPDCGYRACDAALHMDHRLCRNSGSEPWKPKENDDE